MTPLALIFLLALAAAGYSLTQRARAALLDARGYGRHAAATRPTLSRRGWDTGALPIALSSRRHP